MISSQIIDLSLLGKKGEDHEKKESKTKFLSNRGFELETYNWELQYYYVVHF